MQEIGLIPSDTGQPCGKTTGQRVSHYIKDDGNFSKHCAELLKDGFVLPFVELWDEVKASKGKAKNKTKFISGRSATTPGTDRVKPSRLMASIRSCALTQAH